MNRTSLLLTLAIALPALGQEPQTPPRLAPETLLQQFDRDGDGKVSRTEAPPRMQQRWDQIDTDRDGFIGLEELQARDARAANMGSRPGPSASLQPPQGPAAALPSPTAAAVAIPGTRAYVNAAHTAGAHDGKSWATAFTSVQDALTARAAEIWVARGTYTPGADRSATFHLLKGGALYGGFSGNETGLNQRNWTRNPTILDGHGATHVVTGSDDALLDGFTITGGNAMGGEGGGPPGAPGVGAPAGGPPGMGGGGRPIHITPQTVMSGSNSGSGAGMLNFQTSPTVRNCIFENNQAGKGGGVYNMTGSFPPRPGAISKTPVFINCVFRKNIARGRGGGVSNDLGTAPTFLNCVFDSNETPQKGGGMYNDFGCSPTLINCLFTGNSAQSAGGMGNDGGSSPVLYFCTFTKNHAVDYGAPLYQGTGPASNPSLINCEITSNICDWESPGIYNWHDCAPLIKESTSGDRGYKAGRFSEAQLPQLHGELAPYKVPPQPEPLAQAPERIPSSNRIVYVNAAAGKNGDGRSWTTAYASLSTALNDAGKDGAEVRVAAGTYRIGKNRSESFALRPGVRLLGGFNATDAPRDPAKNPTILDGNRAYHVLIGANGATLDGFTIIGGYADGVGYDGKGGGLINYRRGAQSRPNSEVVSGFTMTINQCTFTNNYARNGGAVYSYDRAKPVFTSCTFAGNQAENGGAVLDRVGVESTFTKCSFADNTASWRGGAVYFDYGSRPVMTDCVFSKNTTGGHGGAAFSVSRASQLENTIVTIKNCQFEKNIAKGNGGAAAFCDSSISNVQDCSFTGNKAGKEGNNTYNDASSSQGTGESVRPSRGEPTQAGGFSRRAKTSGGTAEGAGMGRGTARAGGPAGENLTTEFHPTADFSVVILGSGSPQYDPKRSGPSTLIQMGGQYFLVDMGNGTQARLNELGVSLRDVAALMLTHHHIDHNEEFVPMLVYRLVRGRSLDIIGPPGTEKYVAFTREFYAEDMNYRMSRRGRTLEDAGEPTIREVKGGESFTLGTMKVTTAKVDHTIYTVAYRFEANGQSIVISGDTTYSDRLIELARGADVLVLDSGASLTRQGTNRRPGGTNTHNEAHSSFQEVCTMAQKSGVKELVLTHIAPGEIDEAATIKAIGENYSGKVVIAHDLMEIVPGKS